MADNWKKSKTCIYGGYAIGALSLCASCGRLIIPYNDTIMSDFFCLTSLSLFSLLFFLYVFLWIGSNKKWSICDNIGSYLCKSAFRFILLIIITLSLTTLVWWFKNGLLQ